MYSAIKRTPTLAILIYASLTCASGHAATATPSPSSSSPQATTTPSAKTEAAKSGAPANPQPQATAPLDQQTTCARIFEKYVLPIQDLWSKRANTLRPENTGGYALIEDNTKEHCADEQTRKDLIDRVARILNYHSGKIGVIVPLTGNNYLRHLIAAFEQNIRSNQGDPSKILIVMDTPSDPARVQQALASMVFEHKVSTIIGGTVPGDAAILKTWSEKLLIPTFLLLQPLPGPPSPTVFYVHPTQKSLAVAAVAANVRFGHRRVSILSPGDRHSDRFIEDYEAAAKASGISVIQRVPYDSKRFDLMESAARKIFRLDTADRRDELKKLYTTAKEHAQQTGVPFNPKMVALQPDIQQDAVLIPDNFKIVRHFAKIFTYLGVRRMPLFGHYEWRSMGLISPWDSFMNGSYFVDFQGAYASMPEPIRIPSPESPYIIAPDKVEQADYSLIGWRAIEWPLRLSQNKNEMRRKMFKLISQKPDGTTTGFDQDHAIIWAPSTFTVTGNGSSRGSLNLIH